MKTLLNEKVSIGGWSVDLAFKRLSHSSGKELFPEPRLLRLLYVLALHQNEIVPKEELTKFVWEGVVVGDDSLNKAIYDLRKLGAKIFGRRFEILTIRKVGYKLSFTETQILAPNQFLGKLARISLYVVGVTGLLILLVRAFRYEQ